MFGEYFRKYREEAGLTEAELVERLRAAGHTITLARYKRIEENKSNMFLNDLKYMSLVLQVSPDQLVGNLE